MLNTEICHDSCSHLLLGQYFHLCKRNTSNQRFWVVSNDRCLAAYTSDDDGLDPRVNPVDGGGTFQARRNEGDIHKRDGHLGFWDDRIREFSYRYIENGMLKA